MDSRILDSGFWLPLFRFWLLRFIGFVFQGFERVFSIESAPTSAKFAGQANHQKHRTNAKIKRDSGGKTIGKQAKQTRQVKQQAIIKRASRQNRQNKRASTSNKYTQGWLWRILGQIFGFFGMCAR